MRVLRFDRGPRSRGSCGRVERARSERRARGAAGAPAARELVNGLDDLPLETALAAIDRATHTAAPDPEAAAWARTTLRLDTEALDAWLVRATWGRLAGRLVARRLVTGRADEVAPLLDPPDLAPLDALDPDGRGALVAGAHVGPPRLTRWVLARSGRSFRAITGRGRAIGADLALDAASPAARARSLLAARRIVESGGITYTSADGRHGGRTVRARCLGRSVTMYPGIAALTRLTGRPSCPAAVLWTSARRLRLAFGATLPTPGRDEGAAFETRWVTAYLAWLESVLRGPAENVRLEGGLWKKGAGGWRA